MAIRPKLRAKISTLLPATNLLLLKRLWRTLENVLFGIAVFFIAIYFLLQMPSVQNWLVQKVTGYLSEEWETKVSIKSVQVDFFDHLILEQFFIEDFRGDTLIYADNLTVGMKGNFFSFLGSHIKFDEIGLSGARLNITREEGDPKNSLNEFIAKISGGGGNNKKGRKVTFDIQNLHLNDVLIVEDVETYNKKNAAIIDREQHIFNIPSGQVRIKNIDTDDKLIDIQSAQFDGVQVILASYERAATIKRLPEAKKISQKTSIPGKSLTFRVGNLLLTNGEFKMDRFDSSPAGLLPPEVMDYEHLDIKDIVLQGKNLEFNDEFNSNEFRLKGTIQNLSAKEQCGFDLTHAEIGDLYLSDSIASLNNIRINTPNTTLGDTIQFTYSGYRDFRSFDDNVYMDIRLKPDSRLRIGDLNFFDKHLNNSSFFIKNANEIANLSGDIHGTVNRLRANDLKIGIDNDIFIDCNFRGNNLSTNDEPQTLNFEFKELRSDLNSLNRIIPDFKPPQQFYKLGSIRFKGDYQLFDRVDHVLFGDIVSDLGPGRVDMHLNLKEGREKAVYSGGLEMRSFDMETWTGDSQFGRSTFRVNIAENSTGLTINTIKAKVSGKIDTLSYRNYQYRDIYLNGAFREKVFEGDLLCSDPNVDFTFDGTLNFSEEIPKFRFSSKIKRLDLGVLNLTDDDIVLFADVENLSLEGKTIDEITGSASLKDIKVLQDREDWHIIDSLQFVSFVQPSGNRYFGFNSDVAKCELSGIFNLNNIPSHLAFLLKKYHPSFAERLHVTVPPEVLDPKDNYTLSLQIKNSRDLTKLLSPALDTLRDVSIFAYVNAVESESHLSIEAPQIKVDGITFINPGFSWISKNNEGSFRLNLPQTYLNNKQNLPPISFAGDLVSDELNFTLEASESNSLYLENLFLKGKLSTVDTLWQVQFNSSKIAMFSQEWLIADDNYIRFGNEYIDTKKFEFFNGDQRILLEDNNNGRGLTFSLTNFNLIELNRFLDEESIQLRGNIYDFDITVRDVFNMEGLEAGFLTDTVFVNEQPYGILLSNIEMEGLDDPLYYKIFLQNDNNQRLRVSGIWLPNAGQAIFSDDMGATLSAGELFASATIRDFPFAVLETFIPEISKTAGSLDANLTVSGAPDRVGLSGPVLVREGQFQIDYLKSMFHLRDQQINITKNKIEVIQDTIYDASQQHMAIVNGSLEHDNFSKWRVNCEIESQDRSFMIMNTSIQDNELYYGQGIGYFKLNISGSFVRTNMQIDAITGRDTRLYIPLSGTSDAKEVSFITFTNGNVPLAKDKNKGNFTITDLKGLNFEMNLTVTEDAEIQLIFDEQAGDIIKSRGVGDIKLSINREGEFKMYGGYRVSRGEYLFTLLNFVNKPFTMISGGTINWFGNPYGAELSLDATYEQNTSVYNFIRDEVELLSGINNLKAESQKATRVVVSMHISGDLLKPDITFDLEFPNATSQLKSLTDNKLRLIKQDQNELSRQVFGLIVMGGFLPANSGFVQPSEYVASAFNTVTQMISNQFSSYLGGLAAEWFNKDVSSIDFDIIYSNYQNVLSDPVFTGAHELQVRFKSGFINDKITVQVGSQFGLGGGNTNLPVYDNGFLGEDVTVEIRLTENNQWRLKVYQRLEPDISGQRRDCYGVGLSFQKDYDSFGDVWKGVGKRVKQ
ncbi:MAG: translocation/assembly module TamB domain-containing protein [Saprospiraceae bacterium]